MDGLTALCMGQNSLGHLFLTTHRHTLKHLQPTPHRATMVDHFILQMGPTANSKTAMAYCLKLPITNTYSGLITPRHFLVMIPSILSNRPSKSIPTTGSSTLMGQQLLCKVPIFCRPPFHNLTLRGNTGTGVQLQQAYKFDPNFEANCKFVPVSRRVLILLLLSQSQLTLLSLTDLRPTRDLVICRKNCLKWQFRKLVYIESGVTSW